MESEYKEGPWLVGGYHVDEYDIVNYSIGPEDASDGSRFVEDIICQVSSPNESEETVQANAYLISAAPDGYEAARQAYVSMLLVDDYKYRLNGEFQYALCLLRNFLAKATNSDPEEIQSYYSMMAMNKGN